mmetsp:Transcript_36287/g.85655  ORF Transcript_36287/g.85655 Transcript_36287/m.85655 type:complete len:244 (-) Transcript_36287:136-867(-)
MDGTLLVEGHVAHLALEGHEEEARLSVVGLAAPVDLGVRVDEEGIALGRPHEAHLARLVEGLGGEEATLAVVSVLPQPHHGGRALLLRHECRHVVRRPDARREGTLGDALDPQLVHGLLRGRMAVEEVHLVGHEAVGDRLVVAPLEQRPEGLLAEDLAHVVRDELACGRGPHHQVARLVPLRQLLPRQQERALGRERERLHLRPRNAHDHSAALGVEHADGLLLHHREQPPVGAVELGARVER